MVAAISSAQDGNRRILHMWAAYLGGVHSRRTRQTATLETRPMRTSPASRVAILPSESGTLHAPSCRCTLCSGADLSISGTGLNGGKIFTIKLSGELTEEDKKILEHLRRRDAEVRRHEQAHLMAAGPYALGRPSYTYQVGPDGQRYAVGGEVQVDLSEEADPEATLRKAQVLRQAALAPSDPSTADRQVAMLASRMAREALQDLASERTAEREETSPAHAEQMPEPEPEDELVFMVEDAAQAADHPQQNGGSEAAVVQGDNTSGNGNTNPALVVTLDIYI